MSIGPLLFQGKLTEKYFMKFHLPKIQIQPLSGPSMDLLSYQLFANLNPDSWGQELLIYKQRQGTCWRVCVWCLIIEESYTN